MSWGASAPSSTVHPIATLLCRCGHIEERHLHHRGGSECSQRLWLTPQLNATCACSQFRRKRLWNRFDLAVRP